MICACLFHLHLASWCNWKLLKKMSYCCYYCCYCYCWMMKMTRLILNCLRKRKRNGLVEDGSRENSNLEGKQN